MLFPAWLGLGLKLLASAVTVVAASLVAETAGPMGAALIASLPISAGPAYVLLALDHDGQFIAQSALGSLVALPAVAVFVVVYARLAKTAGLAISLLAALIAWALAAYLVQKLDLSLGAALALNTLAFAAAAFATRHFFKAELRAAGARRWWEVPARAILVAGLVGVVLVVGRVFGPAAAGLTAVFPLTMTSLVLILHPRLGWQSSVAMLVNSLLGMIGFGAALALVALTATRWAAPVALSLALLAGVTWNFFLLALHLTSLKRDSSQR
jgi:hypothetical protein